MDEVDGARDVSLLDMEEDHGKLLARLAALRDRAQDTTDDAALAAEVAEAIDAVQAHMAREERYLLALYHARPFDLSSHLICNDVFSRRSDDIVMSLTAHPNTFLAQRCAEYLDAWYREHMENQDHDIDDLARDRRMA